MTGTSTGGGSTGGATSAGSGSGATPTEAGGTSGPASASGEMSEGTGDSTGTGGPAQDLVPVGHTRELRGVWVASVGNINFPSAQGLGVAALQDELRATLDAVAAAGLNAVFLQVRPECDALYASPIEPWSRYLTGTQGGDPGFDPLSFAVAEAHLRGLELHAWFNPYRAGHPADTTRTKSPLHLSRTNPAVVHPYGPYQWMDPGEAVVRRKTVDVVVKVRQPTEAELKRLKKGQTLISFFYPGQNEALLKLRRQMARNGVDRRALF